MECKALYFISVTILMSVVSTVNGDCLNKVDKDNPIFIDKPGGGKIKITDCNVLASDYNVYCDFFGGENGICCKACKGGGNCKDSVSPDLPIYIHEIGTSNTIKITSCKTLKNNYSGFCAPDAYGGKKNLCCKSCRGLCVDSPVWKFPGRKCKNCNCIQLFTKIGAQAMQKLCKRMPCVRGKRVNKKKGLCIRKACCRQCTKLGYPPRR